MNLSNELISQFVKVTKDEPKAKSESTVYGTTVEYDGSMYVQFDGSELLTPVATTTDMVAGERVMVTIKNHTATVTGNVSSPSARTDDVKDVSGKVDEIGDQISEFDIVIADRVTAEQLNVERARIDSLVAKDVEITGKLEAAEAEIESLVAENATIEGKLTATEASITTLQTEKLDADFASITYAEIEDLEVINQKVYDLDATYGDFEELATGKFKAIEANISELETNKLSAEEAEIKFANIDFSNIGTAAIEYFYATSGLIEDIVVGDGTITGNLVGVTIKGDLIEGGTVIADKLVIKGEDGLYYKLNTDGVTTESEQTEYNSINGSIITAKSITATKISVSDLVAFDATIGGFNITDNSLYSGAKASVDNTTRGIYLDSEGQVAFGDSANYLKYYKDPDTENYALAISAQSVMLASKNKTVEEVIEDVENVANDAAIDAAGAQNAADNAAERVVSAETAIRMLNDNIAMLVTDENGSSRMTQTGNGWTFSIGELAGTLDEATENINGLATDVADTRSAVEKLQQSVSDLGILANYVRITVDGDQPCIELGESENDFKVRITNTEIHFADGTVIPTRIMRQMMIIEKAMVRQEFQFGDDKDESLADVDTKGVWVWKRRNNGNLGLVWKDVSE